MAMCLTHVPVVLNQLVIYRCIKHKCRPRFDRLEFSSSTTAGVEGAGAGAGSVGGRANAWASSLWTVPSRKRVGCAAEIEGRSPGLRWRLSSFAKQPLGARVMVVAREQQGGEVGAGFSGS